MSDETGRIHKAYAIAKEHYAEFGVDTDQALHRLGRIPLSIHCWQGDDIVGFEDIGEPLGGGLAVTGTYPGRARNADELRSDLAFALSLIPGHHRVNLHSIYAETGGKRVERSDLEVVHFQRWIDWAKELGVGLDFNPTYFAHPLAASGYTLSHQDESVRRYWIDHGIACRQIGAAIGQTLGSPCITNLWVPDGSKDIPVDRRGPRERLRISLDEIFSKPFDPEFNLDAVESKLFGIGSESYVVGSHEFYLGYALQKNLLLCLDMGHFHPTESVADKISAVLLWLNGLLMHVSRGVRWDSDHVVILSDELRAVMQEIIRGDFHRRTRIALDFFDASINRIAAWIIGCRATLKALLLAILEPIEILRDYELGGDNTSRLALLDDLSAMNFGAVWDYYCANEGVGSGSAALQAIHKYESSVLVNR